MRFSICTARKKLALLLRPVADVDVAAERLRAARARRAARAYMSSSLQPHAGHARRPAGTASARPRCGSARAPESNSKCPTSKMPTTVNCLQRAAAMPAGVTWPCGAISVDLVARRRRRARAPARCRARCRIRPAAARRGCRRASCAAPMSATCVLVLGQRCRARTRRAPRRPCDSMPCAVDERRRARRPADCLRSVRPRTPASRRARRRAARSATCEATPRMRVAHLLLEAVHHRQHDDQRRHAERDAGDTRPR